MLRVMVAIRDRAIDAFMQPFFVPARGAAIRAFQDEINRKDGDMYKHPDDYDLYFLGTYDDSDGSVVSGPVEVIVLGKQMVIKGE